MGMKTKGLKKAITACDKFEKELEDAAGETVNGGLDILQEESVFLVPKETGALAASAHTTEHISAGPRRSGGVLFGEGALNSNGESYAAAVHEILKASHASPTQAKYVEDPLFQQIPEYHTIGTEKCEVAKKKAFK